MTEIDDIIDYFEQRADADQPSGASYPTPNEEMRLMIVAQRIKELLFPKSGVLPIAEIDATDRINGMGEADAAGSYVKVYVCIGKEPNQLKFNCKISEGQAQYLRDGLVAFGARVLKAIP